MKRRREGPEPCPAAQLSIAQADKQPVLRKAALPGGRYRKMKKGYDSIEAPCVFLTPLFSLVISLPSQ
jgi:hypothetical protein